MHVIPLPPLAQALLHELHEVTGRSPYLFPSHRRDTGEQTHLTRQAIGRAVRRSQRHFGFEQPFTPHDLRRTCRTQLAKLGVPIDIAERVIGHSAGGLVRVYDRYQYFDEKKAALIQWNQRLQQLIDE